MLTKNIETKQGRRELKHAITKLDCYLLRNNLCHVMYQDPHTDQCGKYSIRSVYFDNIDNKVMTEKKEGYYHRDEFRVRLYNYSMDFLNLEKIASAII